MDEWGRVRMGTSGYQYPHWKGLFYPKELPLREWFAYYARHFDTVEINNSFYRLPFAEVFQTWREQAPPDFLYAVKYSRYGTHMKKLKDPEGPLQLFLERAERLGNCLGPVLVQLPPHWKVNLERLRGFLEATPPRHRWAVEFRDASWLCEEVYALLEQHGAALCIHDLLPDHPWRVTAPWIYLRFHGGDYSGNYSEEALRGIAGQIRDYVVEGWDVYAYFNNDIHGHALWNALDLRRFVQEGLAESRPEGSAAWHTLVGAGRD